MGQLARRRTCLAAACACRQPHAHAHQRLDDCLRTQHTDVSASRAALQRTVRAPTAVRDSCRRPGTKICSGVGAVHRGMQCAPPRVQPLSTLSAVCAGTRGPRWRAVVAVQRAGALWDVRRRRALPLDGRRGQHDVRPLVWRGHGSWAWIPANTTRVRAQMCIWRARSPQVRAVWRGEFSCRATLHRIREP